MSENEDDQFRLDGEQVEMPPEDAGRALATVLRERFGKTGTHVGCMNGDCGACTVLIDGKSYKSCLVPAGRAVGRGVTTIEGIADGERLNPVQQAYWEENAFQCGFCLAGHVLCTVEVMAQSGSVTERDVTEALAGNLCRCTGYEQICNASLKALGLNRPR